MITKLFSFLLVIQLFSPLVYAKTLHEGWYKVLVGEQHAGYYVNRYEFNEKTKQYIATYFLRSTALGGNVTESLKATSDKNLKPVKYQFTNQTGKKATLIDATFNNGVMTAKAKVDGQEKTGTLKLKKDTFLSSFLIYLILQHKEGLTKGLRFQYTAIAEENGNEHKGDVYVADFSTENNVGSFKVLNTFMGTKWISQVTPKGVVLSSRSPMTGLRIISASREAATKGMPSNTKALKTLFGTIPTTTFN